jgi:G protein beta subunit-like protein
LIAADENGNIKIWDINKGQTRTEYNSYVDDEEGYGIRSISVSDTEKFLVAAKSNGTCLIFDYSPDKDLKLVTSFEAHKTYITKCLLNPEQKYLLLKKVY